MFSNKKKLIGLPPDSGIVNRIGSVLFEKSNNSKHMYIFKYNRQAYRKKSSSFFFLSLFMRKHKRSKKKKKDKLNYFFFLLISSIIVPIYKNASAIYYYIFVLFNLYVEVFAVAWSELTTKEQHHSPANEGKIKPNPR
jgi:hypothetical protein